MEIREQRGGEGEPGRPGKGRSSVREEKAKKVILKLGQEKNRAEYVREGTGLWGIQACSISVNNLTTTPVTGNWRVNICVREVSK